jgi:NAD(P)-dependent dehydrogenase (short-subunit alcohol dehydrogenase family)
MMELKGRVAVVTGAGSGIGLALATRLAAEGMKLAIADIEQAALERAAQALRAGGTEVLAQRVDVASEAQVNAFADAVFAHYGRVHVVCNNAGVAAPALMSPVWQSSIADWQWIMGVNFMGVLHGVRAFVPRMLSAGDEGHVVNTASVAGLLTAANPYHVSKNSVTCLTEGLYKDLKAMGAKVSASVLCPGLINTAILRAERNRPAEFGPATDVAALPEAMQRWVAGFKQSLETGYDPSQVADAVADAVKADRFYVIPAQPHLVALINTRMQDIIAQRNPTLPPPPPARG